MSALFTLEEDQRSDVERLVRSCVVAEWRTASNTLVRQVEASVAAWSYENSLRITATNRNQLSDLVSLLTDLHRPKIGLIRARVAKLPPGIVKEIEGRIGRLLVVDQRYVPLGIGLKVWAEKAQRTELLALLRGLLINGGRIVAGRKRSDGKQSAARVEPMFFGQGKGLPADQRSKGGRPERDDLRLLISFLAIDWLQSTGLQPDEGRSDHTPFGALVFMVFRWIGEEDKAGHSLRTYWDPPKPRLKKNPLANLSQG